jgi:hypothetical protein
MKENDLTAEFESWANEIAEGTWSLPDTDDKIYELDEIMAKPLEAGMDGSNATSMLYDIIGDDTLFDAIGEAADVDGPEVDVRPLVVNWLAQNNPELAAKYQTAAEPQQAQPNQTVAQTTAEPSAPQGAIPSATESADGLDFLRSLAGLRK